MGTGELRSPHGSDTSFIQLFLQDNTTAGIAPRSPRTTESVFSCFRRNTTSFENLESPDTYGDNGDGVVVSQGVYRYAMRVLYR